MAAAFCPRTNRQQRTAHGRLALHIGNLGRGDYVRFHCAACGHDELLTADQLRVKGLALPPQTRLGNLEPKLRCRECDAKGKVERRKLDDAKEKPTAA